jgi:TgpA N-terminal domain/Transglutaminase-like superfamily
MTLTRTLRSAHEAALALAVMAALVLVFLGGEFPAPTWLLAGTPALSFFLAQRRQSLPGWTTLVAIAVGIAFAATSLWSGGADNAVFALGMLLLSLLVGRVLTRTTLAHDLQSLVLSLMLVLAGSVLNVGMSFFVCLVAFAVFAVWALSTRQLLVGAVAAQLPHAGDRDDVIDGSFFGASSLVSVIVLGFSVALFVAFPRIGIAELSHFFQRNSGKLATSVRLGGLSFSLGGSTQVVARIDGVGEDAFDDGLYLRAIVYDELDGSSFRQSTPTLTDAPADERTPLLLAPGRKASGPSYTVQLFPVAGELVLTLGPTMGVRVLQGGSTNPNLPLWYRGVDRHSDLRFDLPVTTPVRYEVTGSIATLAAIDGPAPKRPLSDDERRRYLVLPSDTIAQLTQVADELAEPADQVSTATRLRDGLLSNKFGYQSDGGGVGQGAVLDFLSTSRLGNCELFAAGYAMLLRQRGIPSRVVGGFQGGVLDENTGTVIFQERHAHAWVEWYDDARGWRLDDATPVAGSRPETLSGWAQWLEQMRRQWSDRVVDYQLEDQQSAFQALRHHLKGLPWRGALLGALGVCLLAAVVFWWLRRRHGFQRGHDHQLIAALLDAHARIASSMAASMTWREALQNSALPESVLPVMTAATDAVERLRFGGTSIDRVEMRRHVAALRALRRVR